MLIGMFGLLKNRHNMFYKLNHYLEIQGSQFSSSQNHSSEPNTTHEFRCVTFCIILLAKLLLVIPSSIFFPGCFGSLLLFIYLFVNLLILSDFTYKKMYLS